MARETFGSTVGGASISPEEAVEFAVSAVTRDPHSSRLTTSAPPEPHKVSVKQLKTLLGRSSALVTSHQLVLLTRWLEIQHADLVTFVPAFVCAIGDITTALAFKC